MAIPIKTIYVHCCSVKWNPSNGAEGENDNMSEANCVMLLAVVVKTSMVGVTNSLRRY